MDDKNKESKEVKYPRKATPKRTFTYKKTKYTPEKKFNVASKEVDTYFTNAGLI